MNPAYSFSYYNYEHIINLILCLVLGLIILGFPKYTKINVNKFGTVLGYLILFFIVLTPDINNAVGRGIQALLFCVLGYSCEENIRRFIKNR